MEGKIKVGQVVEYVAPDRTVHDALVTQVWGPEVYADDNGTAPSINLVFVSDDEKRGDTYGRQVERNTSVVHESRQAVAAAANFWREKK